MPQPATAPAVAQAFALDTCCNSLSTDCPETPPTTGQLIPPTASYPQAIKAWRREWRVWVPGQSGNNPYRSPGLRKLIVGAQNNVANKNYAAQANILAFNIWDNQQPANGSSSPSSVSNSIVQIAAYCMNASGVPVPITPPILQYAWGVNSGSLTWQALPSYPAGQNYVQLPQPVGGLSLGSANPGTFDTNPAYGMMYGCDLISFQFNDSITLPTTPSGLVNPIRLQVAVYATLTNAAAGSPALMFYDDPEMEVDTSE
jgi:hypothetical protein